MRHMVRTYLFPPGNNHTMMCTGGTGLVSSIRLLICGTRVLVSNICGSPTELHQLLHTVWQPATVQSPDHGTRYLSVLAASSSAALAGACGLGGEGVEGDLW